MYIHVNGQIKTVDDNDTILILLQSFQLGNELVAVEHNGDIVPRELFPMYQLHDGDHIEIVRFVGGG